MPQARSSRRDDGRKVGKGRVTRPSVEVSERAPSGKLVRSTPPRWLIPLGIVAATLVVFAPTVRNGFVSWDDSRNFLENPHYRGLGLEQLRWMWSTFLMGHYVPLTWMTLGADYVLWNMDPAGYHATSLLIHAANAVLVFALARRVLSLASGGDGPGANQRVLLPAAFAALVFAVHPLRVESVAWITERRDTLSLFFYLSSALAYLRHCEAPSWRARWYWLSLGAFLCALLSKGTSVTLPAVLALLNVYPLRRVTRDNWRTAVRSIGLELLPFAALSAGFSLLSVVALHPPTQLPFAAKLAVSAYSVELYLVKTIAPIGLSPLYEMPAHVDPLAPKFLIAYAFSGGLALVAWFAGRRWPACTAALVAFTIITLPMLRTAVRQLSRVTRRSG
jgi:protein O-mannosyl-transferase